MTLNPSRLTRLKKCLEAVLPRNATAVHVHNFNKMEKQGTTTIMYYFCTTYVLDGLEQRKDFVLRIYREGSEKIGSKEFTILKALTDSNFPVPTPYYFEPDKQIIGKPFLVLEKIVGKTASYYLKDDFKSKIIVDKMAKILARLHQLDPNCIQDSDILRKQYERRQQGLLKIRSFINTHHVNFLGLCPLRQRTFITAVKRLKKVKPKKFIPSILHLDYEPDHVLISNGQYTIVDWGMASIGDSAVDVAWTYHKLRLGRETAKMDLGEYFVTRYKKHTGQKLVNLQFQKDMVAIEIASWFGLSPFRASASQFRNHAKLIDLTFGNIFGRILEARKLQETKRLLAEHHNSIWSNIDYIQSYATKYLEKDRYIAEN